jgi:ribosomal protein S27E
MTNLQKERIADMRHRGLGYTRIAESLGISENTVKSYCQRNNLGGNMAVATQPADSQTFCRQCGKELKQNPGKKPIKFCSAECRAAWWKSHPERLNMKAVYRFTCPACGAEFTVYGNAKRKYCCHACYIAGRFGKGAEA